jgi:hypothetical protein
MAAREGEGLILMSEVTLYGFPREGGLLESEVPM